MSPRVALAGPIINIWVQDTVGQAVPLEWLPLFTVCFDRAEKGVKLTVTGRIPRWPSKFPGPGTHTSPPGIQAVIWVLP
jgi:hypothetical protein